MHEETGKDIRYIGGLAPLKLEEDHQARFLWYRHTFLREGNTRPHFKWVSEQLQIQRKSVFFRNGGDQQLRMEEEPLVDRQAGQNVDDSKLRKVRFASISQYDPT